MRTLRTHQPEPPRDLWARTAAAIERESTAGRPTDPDPAPRRRSLPMGALVRVAVIALVVGVSTLSGGALRVGSPQGAPAATAGASDVATVASPQVDPGVEPTPMAVGAGDVTWIDEGPGGSLGYAAVTIDEVCPRQGSGCPMIREGQRTTLGLSQAPRTIFGSPTHDQAVAISDNGDAGDQLVIVRLPAPPETDPPSPSPSPTSPPASDDPSGTPTISPTPSTEPDATPTPTVEVTAGPTIDPLATPSQSPEPTIAATIAIASDIEVIGESAAFSADGRWFAFTARPVDGSSGPDVYVWEVGDDQARPLTDDGVTYFASWAGDELIASRPGHDGDAGTATSTPETLRIDPATGDEIGLGDLWRPIVDPTGTLAIGWSGSLERIRDDGTWSPASGTLELRGWSDRGARQGDDHRAERIVTDKAIGDFDIRWDETGEWVATWVADPRDATIGRLTLYRVDVDDERLERVEGAPVAVPALPGFSIGDGRLAWATPPGQDGEGSRIQIAAWSAGDVGTLESAPGEGIVVVR